MTRFVIDAGVILHFLAEGIELPNRHKLLAPTLVCSEVLDALYGAVQRGELSEDVGRQRLARFAEGSDTSGVARAGIPAPSTQESGVAATLPFRRY